MALLMYFFYSRRFNLTRSSLYTDMPDPDLDNIVSDIVAGNDLIGPEAVRASLLSKGLRVQRKRVRESMLRLNPGAAALRAMTQRPERRVYHVTGPNSLWHIDGNHKLIRCEHQHLMLIKCGFWYKYISEFLLNCMSLIMYNIVCVVQVEDCYSWRDRWI